MVVTGTRQDDETHTRMIRIFVVFEHFPDVLERKHAILERKMENLEHKYANSPKD